MWLCHCIIYIRFVRIITKLTKVFFEIGVCINYAIIFFLLNSKLYNLIKVCLTSCFFYLYNHCKQIQLFQQTNIILKC